MVTGLVWAKLERVSARAICRACGCTTDADWVVGESPCLAPRDDAGYLIEEAEIRSLGDRPDCRRTRTTSSTQ